MPFSVDKSERTPGGNSHRVAFDRFELDLRSGELRKDERRIRLQAQPFQLLVLLIENAGQVVMREEVCRALWQADTFVDFDHSVAAAVNKIREALGDSAEDPRFVETLPKRGYRFIGKIAEVKGAPSPDGNQALSDANPGIALGSADAKVISNGVPTSSENPQTRRLKLALLAVASLTILLGATFFFRRSSESRSAARTANIRSIAVLPLENLSRNPEEEYFADGMTDELITELARNKDLLVISRTSVMQYKGVRRPLKEIAHELGADGILEGSVMNFDGDVRITVQLVHAASDTHLWAESYTRNLRDLLLMQREIAENVARKVNSELLPHRTLSREITPAAHDAYLRGRYNWFAVNFETARQSFEKAIQLEPNYAAAYSGLADYFIGGSVLGLLDPKVALPKGEVAAQKALQLDDAAEEAHNSMAAAYLFYRWNWKAAEQESRRAIELNPNFAEAHHLYAMVLVAQNRGDEAVEAQRKAQALDPFARPSALGMILSDVGRFAEAEIEYRQRIEALPTNRTLRYRLAECLLLQGREKESMEEFAEGLRLEGNEKQAKDVRAAFTRAANRGVQEWRLADLKRLDSKSYVSPLNFAYAYARLRQDDEAFRWLEKGYDDHVPTLIFLRQNSDLKRLHGDPRFQSLVKRIGLPEAH